MAVKKAVDVEALKQQRKVLAARVQEYEGKIKFLTKELDAEKQKPAFRSSKDPRHVKFQDAARRRLEEMQARLAYFKKMREGFIAEVNRLSLIIKGQA